MISIIIVSWNVRNLLEKCLASIYHWEKIGDFEIIVVDNCSADYPEIMVKKKFPQVKFIKLEKNYGFAYACNQGKKISNGDFLLFLNPDTEWQKDILTGVLNFYKRQEKIGILGIKLLNTDQTLQPWVRQLPDLFSQIVVLLKLHRLFKKILFKYYCLNFNYEINAPVQQVVGAFFFLSRLIFGKIGNFDEKFFTWFEEVDYSQRVLANGYQNYYYSQAFIVHHGEKSFSQVNNWKKQLIFNKSLLYYFRKNKSLSQYLILHIFIPLNLILTFIIQILKLKPKHYL